MHYTFYGNSFFFSKNCKDLEEVKSVITRCKRGYKTQNSWVSRRILEVKDELGIKIFSEKTR